MSMRTVLPTFPEVDHPAVPGHDQTLPQQLRCRSQTTSDRGGRLALFRRQPTGMLRVELLNVSHVLAQDRAAASPQGQLDVRIPSGQKLECRQPGLLRTSSLLDSFPARHGLFLSASGAIVRATMMSGPVVEPGRGTFAVLRPQAERPDSGLVRQSVLYHTTSHHDAGFGMERIHSMVRRR